MTTLSARWDDAHAGNDERSANNKGRELMPARDRGSFTETALADSNLSATELGNLGALCSYGLTIGSSYGLCPCTLEDYDF